MNFGIVDYLVAVILIIVGVFVKLKGETNGHRNKARDTGLQKYIENIETRLNSLQRTCPEQKNCPDEKRLSEEIQNIWKELNELKKIFNSELLSITKIVYQIKGFLEGDEK